MTFYQSLRAGRRSGFSLIEALIVVAVIGILAALGSMTLSNLVSSTREQKLFSDVQTVNRSVNAYLAAGGDLSGAKSPEEVLNALKRNLNHGSRVPTLSGSKIDERLSVTFQSTSESNQKSWRAYWDAGNHRFVLAQSGNAPGVKEFTLDENAVIPNGVDDKSTAPVLYASKDTWIWDYTEAAPTPPAGPSTLLLSEVPDAVAPPSTAPSGGGVVSAAIPLAAPGFSISSGVFPITSFDLPLTLSNPNPAGSSTLYYSIDFGNWKAYSGPLSVAPGSLVAAQAIATSDLYTNSSRVDGKYEATPAGLLPPVISPDKSSFGLFSDRTIRVTLTNLNSSSISGLQYKIGGDPWIDYTGEFTVSRNDYPSGLLIQSRSIPLNPYYLVSTTTLRTLGTETPTITGDALGTFSNPTGEGDMVTNLSGSTSSNYFEWGKDYRNSSGEGSSTLSRSSLSYDGLSFGNVVLGDRFEIGSIDYYNGTILSGTGADSVSFAVDLDFTISGLAAKASFDFGLELINVANRGNPKDPWADADFVRLSDPVSNRLVTFNGVEFNFRLEFGETTSNGISYFDEFHVLENQNATTRLYGTLIEVGSLSFNR